MTAYTSKDTLNAALAAYAACKAFVDATGKLRTRYRANGVAKYTTLEPGSVEFDAWHDALVTGVLPPSGRVVKLNGGVVPKSLAHAYKLLRETREWQGLAPKTRENQETPLDAMLKIEVKEGMLWRDAPMAELSRAAVKKLVTLVPAYQAKQLLTILSKLAEIALDADKPWMEYNPTFGVKVKRPVSKWKPWPWASQLHFEASYAYGTNARTVYELAKWLGVRRSDIATLCWEQLGEDIDEETGELVEGFTFMPYKTRRTGKVIFQPMTDALRAALAHIPAEARKGTVLKAEHGGPYVIRSLSRRMFDWTRAIGLGPGHILHGIRKNMGHDMAAGGATLREGMAGGGWSTPGQFLNYSASYEQKRGAIIASNKVVELRRKREEMRLKKAG